MRKSLLKAQKYHEMFDKNEELQHKSVKKKRKIRTLKSKKEIKNPKKVQP